MYKLSNRRYTGSKYKLLDWIEELIVSECTGGIFFDVFAGTGVVSNRMKNHFKKIVINDFLYSNEVIYKAFFADGSYNMAVLNKCMAKYQTLDPQNIEDNYVSDNYGGKYFSYNDAKVIGCIREDIEDNKGELSNREYNILLAALLYSIDRIANTVGHYDAYRKIKIINDRFKYDLIDIETSTTQFEIYREDANQLVRHVKADVAFIDPPYNSRQYSRFYHVLENITEWKKPELEGVALKPKPENMSEYCKNDAPMVFKDLIENIDARYIVVTYNNTYNSRSTSSRNKITLEEIKEILDAKGSTVVKEKDHPFFNAGKTDLKDHKEFVFITKVGATDDN